jgi:DNA-binding HxlR family transcriptional regulator
VLRSVLDRVGDKESLLSIGVLSERTHRCSKLLRCVPGVSRRMLTVTLRALRRDRLVAREVFGAATRRVPSDRSRPVALRPGPHNRRVGC